MLVSEFYANREIFITGGTGFLGKALIEKLLRSCPNLSKLYVLMRPKRGVNIEERLEELSKNFAFERLHQEFPGIFKDKVHAIVGDCCELGLGISSSDLQLLQNVEIIFHEAANVRFDNSLAKSTIMNVRGTRELLNIAQQLKKLLAFVHVSTAYVNTNVVKDVYEEEITKIPADWRTTIKMAENMNEDMLDIFLHKYSDGFINSYTFTKTLAEQIFEEYASTLPIVVFRPAIVGCSYREPVPGWVDSANGPFGIWVAAALGLQRFFYCSEESYLSIVCIDAVTRATITSAYKKGMEWQKIKARDVSQIVAVPPMDVINCPGEPFVPTTQGVQRKMYNSLIEEIPPTNALWAPSYGCTSNLIKYIFFTLIFDVPLCCIYDGLLRLKGKKPMILITRRRLVFAAKILHSYTQMKSRFAYEKLFAMNSLVPKEEIDTFGLQMFIDIDMRDIGRTFLRNLPRVLQEGQPNEAKARSRMQILIFLDKMVRLTVYFAWAFCTWRLIIAKEDA